MIAILFKDNIVHFFVRDLVSVDGENVVGKNTRCITSANILVVDGFTYCEDEVGECIKNGDITVRYGDTINPANFTDKLGQLPPSDAQSKERRISDLEMAIADIFAHGGV